MRRSGEPLDVDVAVVTQFAQEFADRGRAGLMAQRGKFLVQSLQTAPDVPGAAHGVAARDRFCQALEVVEDRRVFFFNGGRPAPGLRMRLTGRSARSASSSSRPRRIVSTCSPVIWDTKVSPPWPSFLASRAANQRRCCSSKRLKEEIDPAMVLIIAVVVAHRTSRTAALMNRVVSHDAAPKNLRVSPRSSCYGKPGRHSWTPTKGAVYAVDGARAITYHPQAADHAIGNSE